MKRNRIGIYPIAILTLVIVAIGSCKKSSEDIGPNQVKDSDGNVYSTVTIGSQIWMVENLKTTKYNDGTSIPLVEDQTVWLRTFSPAYCWYDNDVAYSKTTYGALYNWYVVGTGKLAPKGWHVPTVSEWNTLASFLGGSDYAGGKMKEMGISHWDDPNVGATNSSGFTGLPAGRRIIAQVEVFQGLTFTAGFWSLTEKDSSHAALRVLYSGDEELDDHNGDNKGSKTFGYSVRCIKD